MNRRDLLRGMLAGGGAMVAAGGLYGWAHGIRFPVLQAEPDARPTRLDLLDPPLAMHMEHAYLQHAARRGDGLSLEIRAFAPQFEIAMSAGRRMALDLLLRNVPPGAALQAGEGVRLREVRSTAVNRVVHLELAPGEHRLAATVPFTESFRFGVIGDTGGGSELAWCLRRAADLDAHFLLHAGDFYYSPADFRSLGAVLDASPLPVYASIGNHDFHRDGRFIHRDFTREIGPRNACFALGDTMIVNFDTAASTWPVDSGERDRLFSELAARRDEFEHWVLMTHRPLHDPRFVAEHDENHALALREVGWVSARLKELTPSPLLLAGHIHVSAEHDEDGIYTFISGDGMGNRNLVSGREIARILVGEKRPGKPLAYRWAPLEMPKSAHCHEKGRWTLKASGKPFPPGSFGPQCPT